MLAARARPPFFPSATAAGSFPSSSVALDSSISPVAIFATMTAAPITSPGRFWPCGPLGISLSPSVLDEAELLYPRTVPLREDFAAFALKTIFVTEGQFDAFDIIKSAAVWTFVHIPPPAFR